MANSPSVVVRAAMTMATVRINAELVGWPVLCEIVGSSKPKAIQPRACQRRRMDRGRVMALTRLRRFEGIIAG